MIRQHISATGNGSMIGSINNIHGASGQETIKLLQKVQQLEKEIKLLTNQNDDLRRTITILK